MNATIVPLQIEQEDREPYLCSLSPQAPVSAWEFKAEVLYANGAGEKEYFFDKDGDRIERPRRRFRTVDFCKERRAFRDNSDEDGSIAIGKIHWLSKREIREMREHAKCFAVRWRGNSEGAFAERPGVGPGGKYRSAQVWDRRTRRYNPKLGDEFLSDYIVLRKLSMVELKAADPYGGSLGADHVPMGVQIEIADRVATKTGGFDAALAPEPTLDDEKAALEALRADLAKREEEIKAREKAEQARANKDEDKALSEPRGIADRDRQTRKKRRG